MKLALRLYSTPMEKTDVKGREEAFRPGRSWQGRWNRRPHRSSSGDNMILSNRDKSEHSDQRGIDSKYVQSEQLQDHAANRLDDDAAVLMSCWCRGLLKSSRHHGV